MKENFITQAPTDINVGKKNGRIDIYDLQAATGKFRKLKTMVDSLFR